MKERVLTAVKDEPNLGRCPESGAILYINKSEIQSARDAKAKRQKKKQQELTLKAKVDNLEKDMSDIKSLLSQLVEKL